MSLQAAPDHRQDVAVISVNGDIDLATGPALREALLPVLEHQTGPVVVDLSEVSFIDSTGVHVLVDTLRRLEPENRRLAIVCREGGPVHRVLALVRLLDTLAVHRSRVSAVIDGGERLQSEAGANTRPSSTRALTESRPSVKPATTGC